MNSSATGGYAKPESTVQLPSSLSLTQFIQSVLVGISGIDGKLVRPMWQQKPPKQPDIDTDWIGFAIASDDPDFQGYLNTNGDGSTSYGRQSTLEVSCKIWGPKTLETYAILRDGFQIPQNNAQLVRANFGFIELTRAIRIPDLINELWFNKVETVLRLHFTTQRTYPILSFLSASGTVYTQTAENKNYQVNFSVEGE